VAPRSDHWHWPRMREIDLFTLLESAQQEAPPRAWRPWRREEI
jgi:hypothetical protein